MIGKRLARKPGHGWLLLAALIAAAGLLAAVARSQGALPPAEGPSKAELPVTVIPTEPDILEEPVQEEPAPEVPAQEPAWAAVEDSYFDDVPLWGIPHGRIPALQRPGPGHLFLRDRGDGRLCHGYGELEDRGR